MSIKEKLSKPPSPESGLAQSQTPHKESNWRIGKVFEIIDQSGVLVMLDELKQTIESKGVFGGEEKWKAERTKLSFWQCEEEILGRVRLFWSSPTYARGGMGINSIDVRINPQDESITVSERHLKKEDWINKDTLENVLIQAYQKPEKIDVEIGGSAGRGMDMSDVMWGGYN